jgi:ABC-type bacteriocin/lantibiotic exporter with double-glycine peptidase domain
MSEFLRTMGRKAKDGTLKTVWQDWKWIWSFSRRHKGAVMAYTLCGMGASGLGLLAGVLSKFLIDSIVAMDLSNLLWFCCATLGCTALSVACSSLTSRLSARLSIDMLGDVQQTVFDSVMRSDWSSISKYPTGELLSRFSGDIGTVSNCAVSWLPGLVIQMFTLISTLAVILYFDPMMALICFATTPVMLLLSRGLVRRQREHNKKMRQVSGDMSAFQSEAFRNMDTLKSFGVENTMSGKLRQRQSAYRHAVLEHNRFTIRTNVFLTILGTVVEYAALAYCLWRLWQGQILFGTMTLFLQQRANLSGSFSALVGMIPTALSGSVAAERIRELTDLPEEPHGQAVTLPEGMCAVELTDITVGYGKGCPILRNVNLTAPAGGTVALVGPSGEGKTTMLRLLLGLIRPESGSACLIDGENTTHTVGADTRRCFTYVPQGNTVIAGTVAENLRLARPDATETQMVQALKDACAWEFVRELPLGLDSLIGEGGKGLSEGQAQRIAIARALMRQAPVMLLDEVTSALDPATEQQVLENLSRLGVTTIVTTHRPSVLDMCQRIYEVRDGLVTRLDT